eukprot:9381315-Lingulodinium_polyedra.AAC.1
MVEEPCVRTLLTSVYLALKFFEEVGLVPEEVRLSASPRVRGALAELELQLAEAHGPARARQARRFPVTL